MGHSRLSVPYAIVGGWPIHRATWLWFRDPMVLRLHTMTAKGLRDDLGNALMYAAITTAPYDPERGIYVANLYNEIGPVEDGPIYRLDATAAWFTNEDHLRAALEMIPPFQWPADFFSRRVLR